MTPFRLILTLCCAVLGSAAAAQDTLVPLEDQARWAAIGRIAFDDPLGQAYCTGALVAPDVVLTAAHCATGIATADADRLATVYFVAGLHSETYVDAVPLRAVKVHPDHAAGPLTPQTIPTDIAIIRLSRPVAGVAPLPTSDLMGFDTDLGYVGYINDLPLAPMTQTGCAPSPIAPDVIAFDCVVVSGNSGAPLLAGLPDSPRIVGVVSARGGPGGLAAALPPWFYEVVEGQ